MFNLIYLYVEVRFSLVHQLLSFSHFFFLVCLLFLFLFFFPSCFTLSLLFCFLFFSSSFLLPKQMRKKNHQHLPELTRNSWRRNIHFAYEWPFLLTWFLFTDFFSFFSRRIFFENRGRRGREGGVGGGQGDKDGKLYFGYFNFS